MNLNWSFPILPWRLLEGVTIQQNKESSFGKQISIIYVTNWTSRNVKKHIVLLKLKNRIIIATICKLCILLEEHVFYV